MFKLIETPIVVGGLKAPKWYEGETQQDLDMPELPRRLVISRPSGLTTIVIPLNYAVEIASEISTTAYWFVRDRAHQHLQPAKLVWDGQEIILEHASYTCVNACQALCPYYKPDCAVRLEMFQGLNCVFQRLVAPPDDTDPNLWLTDPGVAAIFSQAPAARPGVVFEPSAPQAASVQGNAAAQGDAAARGAAATPSAPATGASPSVPTRFSVFKGQPDNLTVEQAIERGILRVGPPMVATLPDVGEVTIRQEYGYTLSYGGEVLVQFALD